MIGLDHCWQHLNLERIALIVFRKNARAIGAYKAAGFKKEGLLKRLFFVDGVWVDVLLMAAFRPSRKRACRIAADVCKQTVPAGTAGGIATLQSEAA
jgi:hypothetical protein